MTTKVRVGNITLRSVDLATSGGLAELSIARDEGWLAIDSLGNPLSRVSEVLDRDELEALRDAIDEALR